jgi:uncharacterized membrane protein YvlD (DUF360 family)
MYYLKNFLIAFFIVFFVNYLFPGIDVVNQSKIPHIREDIFFAAILGFLNSVIFPLLRALDRNSILVRVSIVTFLLNFLSYVILKAVPLGIYVTNIQGYFSAVLAVSFGSILLSYVQLRHLKTPPPGNTSYPAD